MSKQQPKKPVTKTTTPTPKKASGGNNAVVNYLWRNVIVLAGVFGIYFFFSHMYAAQREYDRLRRPYDELGNKYNNLVSQYKQLVAANAPAETINSKIAVLQGLQNDLGSLQGQLAPLEEELIGDTTYFWKVTKGYQWAVRQMAIGNLEAVHNLDSVFHADKTDSTAQSLLSAKLRMKVGVYSLFEYVNKNTPENAVILLPYGDSLLSNTGHWNFIYDPEWTEYFIYPRLCLTAGSEAKRPELAKRLTHVLIVQRRGYDKLKYDASAVFHVPFESLPPEIVLPIDTPPSELKTPY